MITESTTSIPRHRILFDDHPQRLLPTIAHARPGVLVIAVDYGDHVLDTDSGYWDHGAIWFDVIEGPSPYARFLWVVRTSSYPPNELLVLP